MRKNLYYISLMLVCFLVMGTASAKTLFSDDFNDGKILDDGWDAKHFEPHDNGKPSQDVHAVGPPQAYEGTSAKIEDDVAIYHKVDTKGYEDVTLSYCRKTGGVSAGDRLKVGWKEAPLGNVSPSLTYWNNNWNEVESMNDPRWDCKTKKLGSGAENTEIYIAFFLDNGEKDFGFIDNVSVAGVFEEEPPVIKNITRIPEYPVCTSTVRVCAQVTDNVKVGKVKLNYRSSSGSGSWPMTHTTGDTYCGEISPKSVGAKDALMITYEVYAEDVNKNKATSPSAKYTYDCKAPKADAGGPYACDEGSKVMLDASASSDTVDKSLSYAWDLTGNGKYDDAKGVKPYFKCVDDGSYKVSVKVSDDAGHSSVADSSVNVSNVNPVANAGGPYMGYEGSNIALMASATDKGKNDTHTFDWDLDNDNTFEVKGQNASFHCVDEGNFKVWVRVTDDDNGSHVDSAEITCKNKAPVVTAVRKNITVNENDTFMAEFSFKDAGIKDTHMGVIWWNNASKVTFPFNATSPLSAKYRYCNDGSYNVKGVVKDNANAEGHAYMMVTVKNVDPSFSNLNASKTATIDEMFSYDVDASDVGCDTLTYSLVNAPAGVTIDSNTGMINWTPSYGQDGDHVITVKVGDGSSYVMGYLHVHVYDYKIDLKKGLNLISIPLVPLKDNTSINNVFGKEVSSNAEIVWSYTYDSAKDKNVWKYNEPLKSGERWTAHKSRIQNVVPGYGYYILMANATTTYQDGKKTYGDHQKGIPPQVALTTGWNLIGHYGTNVVKKSDEVQDLSGGTLTDLADLNVINGDSVPISVLNPGEGYWAFVTGQNNLLYAPSAKDYEVPKKK